MPLDLHAIVDATIARESNELDERLAAAKRQQRKDEKSIVEQSLLQQYVEVEVAKDPTVLGPVYHACTLADMLNDGLKITADRGITQTEGTTDVPSLLGLKPDEVLPTQTAVKEFQETIIPRVGLKIEDDRDKLIRFCNPLSEGRSTPSPEPLCEAIEDELARNAAEKRKLKEEQDKREKMLLVLANVYEDLMSKALMLLRESFPITNKQQVSEVRQHLARINCLKLKAKVTQLKIESRCIYTAEKVEALKVVRYSLEKKVAQVEKDYEKWSSAARAFENVGDPEFLGVVKEFTSVLEQIKTHEFILNQYVN